MAVGDSGLNLETYGIAPEPLRAKLIILETTKTTITYRRFPYRRKDKFQEFIEKSVLQRFAQPCENPGQS
jgi:hypothetical protein